MHNTDLQSRFAKSYLDAMHGYMNASAAASNAVMGNVFDFWATAAKTMASGKPPAPAPAMLPMMPWGFPMMAPTAMPFWSQPTANPAANVMMPFEFWMSMTPFGRSPVVLQMAYGMMAFGVPRDVAMPTAEANAAAFDAAEIAVGPFQNAFSSYRSDGGHATAQIKFLQRMAAMVMLSPLGAAAAWPMLNVPRGTGF